MSEWIGKFDILPTDGKSCVVTDGKHIGYIIFNDGPRFYGDFDSADITHYMYPEVPETPPELNPIFSNLT